LAKRFGIENGQYDDRKFVAEGDGSFPCVLDHESLKPDQIKPEVVAQFKGASQKRGDSLIAFGWAMAEYLAKLG
jgi:hypothetical protein